MYWLLIKSDLPIPKPLHEILTWKSKEIAIYIFEFLFLIKVDVFSTANNEHFYI